MNHNYLCVHQVTPFLFKFFLYQIIFSQPSGPGSDAPSQHYKVFLKVEEAKKKKADVWTVPSTDSSKKQS